MMSQQPAASNQADLNEIDLALDTARKQPSSAVQTDTDNGNDAGVNYLAKLLGGHFDTPNERGDGELGQTNVPTDGNEWTDVPVIEAKFAEPGQVQATVDAITQPAQQQSSTLLHFKVAWDKLTAGENISELSDADTSSSQLARGGCYEFLKCLIDKADLDPRLSVSKGLIIKLTQTPFDNSNQVHLHILQTIYKKLTGSSIDCPRYGSHWELIGFQGNTPT